MFDLGPDVLRLIVVQMIILILSIAVHEFGHAWVADRLGDGLPRQEGRVTLNPIAHIDPIGTLALPAFGLLATGGLSIGFGWGRPVRVNPVAFSRRFRMKTSHMMVAAAGPAMNILFAIVLSFVLLILLETRVLEPTGSLLGAMFHRRDAPTAHDFIVANLGFAVLMNFVLAFFNLIPAPPLDGGAVLEGVLPERLRPAYQEYAQYGIFVLIAVMLIPTLRQIFVWPATKLFLGLTGLLGLS